MTPQTAIPRTEEDLESALIVASLVHATAKTPKQRRLAWERLMALKDLRKLRSSSEPAR